MTNDDLFRKETKKVLGNFTIRALPYEAYRKFCESLVVSGIVEAPFEVTKENVAKLRDTILFSLVGEIVTLTATNMGALGKAKWIKKHKNTLIV